MSADFVLHSQLQDDTFFVADLPLCRVLLMNQRAVPWLILVPRLNGLKEITDLARNDQIRLLDEIDLTSKVLQTEVNPTKLNIAALGNMVPQLHVHVIARSETDPAWPKPVWGNLPNAGYDEASVQKLLARLRALLN